MPVEQVPVSKAAGRVLAEDIYAELDVPPADNSQMDGYCARVADIGDGAWLPISQRIAAGQPTSALASASCARLFTGAEIPEGADVVVMQEEVTLRENEDGTMEAWLPGPRIPGDNIRRQGRDVTRGTRLIAAGTRLDAAMLGLLGGLALPKDVALLAGTAFVGSYTTFSTWMLETQRLGEERQMRAALANIVVSIALGLAAAFLGQWIAEQL